MVTLEEYAKKINCADLKGLFELLHRNNKLEVSENIFLNDEKTFELFKHTYGLEGYKLLYSAYYGAWKPNDKYVYILNNRTIISMDSDEFANMLSVNRTALLRRFLIELPDSGFINHLLEEYGDLPMF